jgi:hypothetical protein
MVHLQVWPLVDVFRKGLVNLESKSSRLLGQWGRRASGIFAELRKQEESIQGTDPSVEEVIRGHEEEMSPSILSDARRELTYLCKYFRK